MPIEESLSLDLSPALSSIRGELRREIEGIPSTLRDSFGDALTGMASDVGAFAEIARDEIDRVLGSVETVVDVDTSQVDDAAAAIDAAGQPIEAPVESDTAEVNAAAALIDDLSGTPIEVPVDVETSGIEQARSELEGLADAADDAANAVGSIGDAAAGGGDAIGIGAATTSIGGLRSAVEGLTGAELAGLGAGAGLLATIGGFARESAGAQASTRSFNIRVGDLADTLNRVDVAGLNEDLSDLALRLGADDDALRLTLARIVSLSDGSAATRQQVGVLGQEFVALAAYLSSVNPALGTVDQVLESLPQALARGGRALAPFGLSLSAAEIQAKAFGDTGKTTAEDLTLFDRAAAGLEITMTRLGPRIKEGIDSAAGTAEVRLRSLKQTVLETIEAVGGPLIDPVVDSLEAVTPAAVGAAAAVSKVGVAALTVLVPALSAAGRVAEVAAKGIDLIPTPVLAVSASMYLGVQAAQALAAGYTAVVGKVGDIRAAIAALDLGGSITQTVALTAANAEYATVQAAAAAATEAAAAADAEAAAANIALATSEGTVATRAILSAEAQAANTTATLANAAAKEANAAASAASSAATAASLGPFFLAGAAIGAATLALTINARKHADYTALAGDLRGALKAEADALTEVEDAALAAGEALAAFNGQQSSTATRQTLAEAFGDKNVQALDRAGISLDTINTKINQVATSSSVDLGRLRRAWTDIGKEVPKSAADYNNALRQLGGGTDNDFQRSQKALLDTLIEQGPALDTLGGKFFDQVQARKILLGQQTGFVDGIKSETEATRIAAAEALKLSGAYKFLSPELQAAVDLILQGNVATETSADLAQKHATALQAEADAANNAAAGFTAATSALGSLIGLTFDATTQDLNFSITLDKLKAKQDDVTKSKGAAAAAYQLETAAGRENIAALVDMVKAQADNVVKNIQAGESTEKASARYAAQVEALGKVAAQAGLTKTQYEGLLKQYGLTPAQINTDIHATGIPEAKAEADKYKTYLEQLDPQVRAHLTLDAVKFYEALEEVRRRVNLLGPAADVGVAADIANYVLPQARGGIVYDPKKAALGGMNAGIYSAASGVMWNEPDAGGEAYIPFGADRRDRATRVLGEVADRFGFALVPQAREQLSLPADGPLTSSGGGGGTAVLERIASLLDKLPGRMPSGVQANVTLTTQEADVLGALAERLRGH